MSLSARRAWIEIRPVQQVPYTAVTSLSARRAWIEIPDARPRICGTFVALRKESVDRNDTMQVIVIVMDTSLSARRAWIEIVYPGTWSGSILSLSARRAWIEMQVFQRIAKPFRVALRKESVDRNLWWGVRKAVGSLSLSARRAWIEIIDDLEPSSTRKCRSPQGERG